MVSRISKEHGGANSPRSQNVSAGPSRKKTKRAHHGSLDAANTGVAAKRSRTEFEIEKSPVDGAPRVSFAGVVLKEETRIDLEQVPGLKGLVSSAVFLLRLG